MTTGPDCERAEIVFARRWRATRQLKTTFLPRRPQLRLKINSASKGEWRSGEQDPNSWSDSQGWFFRQGWFWSKGFAEYYSSVFPRSHRSVVLVLLPTGFTPWIVIKQKLDFGQNSTRMSSQVGQFGTSHLENEQFCIRVSMFAPDVRSSQHGSFWSSQRVRKLTIYLNRNFLLYESQFCSGPAKNGP